MKPGIETTRGARTKTPRPYSKRVSRIDDETRRVARALSAAPTDCEALAAAARRIGERGGLALFEAMVNEQRGEDVDRKTVVERVMAVLEAMTDAEPAVAGYLMALLYPLASHRGVHDTADAIPLFLTHGSDPRVVDVLNTLGADRTLSPRLQKKYAAWARALRARQAR